MIQRPGLTIAGLDIEGGGSVGVMAGCWVGVEGER